MKTKLLIKAENGLTRREFIKQSLLGITSGSILVLYPQLLKAEIDFFSHPQFPLGDCKSLEYQISLLKTQLFIAKNNPAQIGHQFKVQALANQKQWQVKLNRSYRVESLEQKKFYINTVVAGIGLVLAAIGVAISSPIIPLIGIAVSPFALLAHSIVLKNKNNPDLLIGYMGNRAISLTSLLDNAAKANIKLIGEVMGILGIFLDIQSAWQNKKNINRAVERARVAQKEINSLDGLIKNIGNDQHWGIFRQQILASNIVGLEQFIVETRQTNCLFQLPSASFDNPVIRLP